MLSPKSISPSILWRLHFQRRRRLSYSLRASIRSIRFSKCESVSHSEALVRSAPHLHVLYLRRWYRSTSKGILPWSFSGTGSGGAASSVWSTRIDSRFRFFAVRRFGLFRSPLCSFFSVVGVAGSSLFIGVPYTSSCNDAMSMAHTRGGGGGGGGGDGRRPDVRFVTQQQQRQQQTLVLFSCHRRCDGRGAAQCTLS